MTFCQRFNPVKFDHFLDGGLERLKYYSYSLKTLLQRKQSDMAKLEANWDFSIGGQGRILQETDKLVDTGLEIESVLIE